MLTLDQATLAFGEYVTSDEFTYASTLIKMFGSRFVVVLSVPGEFKLRSTDTELESSTCLSFAAFDNVETWLAHYKEFVRLSLQNAAKIYYNKFKDTGSDHSLVSLYVFDIARQMM